MAAKHQQSEMVTLDKTTLAIILYYVSRLNGVLGKTHLQKMLFLTDLIASKRFQEKLTPIEYKRYLHGPYSPQLNEYTQKLEESGLIEAKEFPLISNPTKTYTRYYEKKPVNARQKLLSSLGSEKMLLLDEIIGSFGNMSLHDVLEVVYSLQMVQEAEMDSPLEMAKKVDNNTTTDEEEDLDLLLQ